MNTCRQRKVLVIASFPQSIISFRGELLSSMLIEGFEVHMAAPDCSAQSSLRKRIEDNCIVVHEVPLERAGINPLADLLLLFHLFRLMRRIRPDVVLVYTIKPVIYGSLAAWLSQVPHRFALITGLGYAFTSERQGFVTKLVQHLYRFALGKTEKIFFQNPDDQALFLERGILGPWKHSVVVNGSGVNLSRYSAAPIPSGTVRFLMVARLLGDKGVRGYVAAAKAMREIQPGAKFRLAGWIDENPDSISQAELDAWVSEGNIEFLGRLNDVRPAIADSTVYVLPSYREGTPRTVLEAMAMGRPIITTDAPGCRETVIDGENGFLVPVKSVDALVEAMQQFIDDPELAEKMGKRSREIAEEKYDVHKVNAVMLREMGIS
jgi:glycosyltransferase involved in cell wall biosynthesis